MLGSIKMGCEKIVSVEENKSLLVCMSTMTEFTVPSVISANCLNVFVTILKCLSHYSC